MSRSMITAPRSQSPDVGTQAVERRLDEMRTHAAQLEVRAHDLAVQRDQIQLRRDQSPPTERARLDKAVADAEHDVTVAMVDLRTTQARLKELEQTREMQQAFTLVPPQPDPFLGQEQIMQILGGGAMLMFPLVLALARRLWLRGGRATPAADLESSPRLQRMEQAIESIAIEVERIGEAQRFATKLMAERDPANRLGAAPIPRREPGTITPH